MDHPFNPAACGLAAAFDALPDALLVLDADGEIVHCNPAAQALFAPLPVALAPGVPWATVQAALLAAPPPLTAGRPLPGQYPVTLRHATPPHPLLLEVTALDEPGAGHLLAFKSVPPAVRVNHADALLALACAHGQVGLWEWDRRSGYLTESGHWQNKTLHGNSGPRVHDSALVACTHPDDVGPVRAALKRYLDGATPLYEVEQRVRLRTGGYATFLIRGQAIARDADGRIQRLAGIYIDLTERAEAQTRLLESRRLLETVTAAFTRSDNTRLLDALTAAAAEVTGADYAFVGIPADDAATDQPARIRVTAAHPAQAPLLGHVYDVSGTPCADTFLRGQHFVSGAVCSRYPDDGDLSAWNVEAYAGQRLAGADGRTVGIFVLLFRGTPPDIRLVRTVSDLFAARAAAEIERERALAELRASERRLNTAIENAGQCVWEWFVEDDALTVLGPAFAGLGIATGAALLERVHPEDRPRQHEALRAHLSGAAPTYEFEGRLRHADGEYRWMLNRAQVTTRTSDGRALTLLGTLTDISVLKAARDEIARSRQFLALVIDTVPQAVFWQDLDSRYLGCNQRFADLARVPGPGHVIGLTDADLWWSRGAADFRREDRELLAGSRRVIHEERPFRGPDGRLGWHEIFKVPMRSGDGRIIGILGAIHDVTTRKEAEESAQRLALFDPLTNLPNRRYFGERLEAALAAAARRARCGALLFIDLDQFKHINDTLGHSVGDQLLQGVAGRLQNVTRQDDVVARLGGDEFVVLLPDLANSLDACARQAQWVAEKIHQALGQPFQFEHHQFHVTPTIGISLFPEAGKDVDDVLKEADTAMYSGKSAGRNVTRFFRPEMEEAAQQRLRIESDLRRALRREEFELFFQPQVDGTRTVIGAEVLLRWRHPERGLIGPAEFIPVAEERGLILDIGRWVLDAAFARYTAWLAEATLDLPELAINVSSRQFRSESFVTDVQALLARHQTPAQRIVFEITESTVIEDVEATIAIMSRLRQLGIRFAIDDFGVGYSSLSYLKRLPIDQLKIDRSFIADIGRDNNDEVICETIVAMSQHLGLQTIAEGVESAAQFAFLTRRRCTGYQGYHFLPPVCEADFLAFCQAR